MIDLSQDVLARLAALERELQDVKARLDAFEARVVEKRAPSSEIPAGPVVAAPSPRPTPGAADGAPEAESLFALAGTLLLALAGGYLVRALTDGGTLSAPAGVALGLAYALAFLPLAGRASRSGRPLAACTHGITAALVAYPLLWEAAQRLKLLPGVWAAALVVAVLAAALALAARRELAPVAWVHTGSALATAAGQLVVTRELTTLTAALLAQAALVEAFARRPSWAGLRWLAAAVVDGAVLAMVYVAGRPEGPPAGYPPLSSGAALSLALALPALYLVRVAAGTLRSRRSVTVFEVLQLLLAVGIGFEGAARLIAARQGSALLLGLAAWMLGLLSYGVAFAFVERVQGRGANFYVYSTSGGLFLLFGSLYLLPPTLQAVAWAPLGVVAAGLGVWLDRVTLRYHALAYLFAAVLASGLHGFATAGIFGAQPAPVSPVAGIVWLASLATYAVMARDGGRVGWPLLPRLLAATITISAIPGALCALAAALGSAATTIMALRTAVLAALALVLAVLGRPQGARPELGWLARAVLAVGGVKLLVQDLPAGNAAELFASLLLLGVALVLVSRLLKAPR